MHARNFPLSRTLGLIALGGGLALSGARAADPAAAVDSFPTFESYVKVSGYAPWIAGDRAAAAQHTGFPNAGAFGLEDLFLTKDLSNDTNLTVKAKALEGAEDYLAQFDLTSNNLGSAEVGYKRYRIFYDGVGGFFPLSNTFLLMSPEARHVDRGAFWIDLKLARPNAPVFTLSYRNEIRSGEKASSEWGLVVNPLATVVNGALVGNAAPANTVAIAPNLAQLAEHHQILEGGMTADLGKTTETLKGTLEWVDNVDTRYYTRYTGSRVIADTPTNVLDDQESVHTRSFHVLNQTETRLGDKLTLETGLSYSHLTGKDGGQWITPAFNAGANAVFSAATAGNIFANPKVDDVVGNLLLKYVPTADWRAEAGFRQEYNVIADAGGFYTTSVATGAKTLAPSSITTANDVTYSHETDHVSTPEVSLEYLGISRVSLYASADDRINRGHQHWINPYAAVTTTGTGVVTTASAPIGNIFFQQANQDQENAKVGANWNASAALTLRIEIFHNDHVNRFIGANDLVGTGSYGALYAIGYKLDGIRSTLIWKPLPVLTFTSAYQPQAGDLAVTANAVNGGLGTESPSGKIRIQSFSETVDWNPIKQFYAQGSVNVVYNYVQTAYPTVVVSATSPIPPPFHNANNNYVVGSALAGFVLDKRDDAQLQLNGQQANNYNRWIAAGGVPYGATYLMESATIGLKHKFSDRLFGEAKAGYLRSTDGTNNGLTNYHGPLAYAALTFAL
ncbi:MAG TPA: hypothetical protein VHC86_12935 [Opitutaceae bacterium]|nr:hypothetical protein [Opitutaceae bacterium]